MKIIILCLALFCFCNTYSQKVNGAHSNVKTTKAAMFNSEPMYFVDSVHVTKETFSKLNPNDIQEVNVVKNGYDSISKTNGKIYIVMKKGKGIKLYNFTSFKTKYLSHTPKPILLMVNSVLVNDYLNFVIDEKSIATIEVDNGADILSIKNIYPNNTIVNVLTKESFNGNSASQILLH